MAISIINMKERGYISQIERVIRKKIDLQPVPGGREICERRLFNMIEKMQNTVVDHGQIDLYIDKAYEMLSGLSKEEIIKRFVSLEFSRFLDYYKNAPDLNNSGQRQPSDGTAATSGTGKRSKGKSMARIVLNIGKGKKITKREIINMVASVPSAQNVEIGLIEIYKRASSVEVDSKMVKPIVEELNGKSYKGLRVQAEENYEFTGVSSDDRNWEPHHRKREGQSGGGRRRNYRS